MRPLVEYQQVSQDRKRDDMLCLLRDKWKNIEAINRLILVKETSFENRGMNRYVALANNYHSTKHENPLERSEEMLLI